jgi:hypothetical protein
LQADLWRRAFLWTHVQRKVFVSLSPTMNMPLNGAGTFTSSDALTIFIYYTGVMALFLPQTPSLH